MTVACFIPIKENSTRVPGKNLRTLGDKPLYQHTLDKISETSCFDKIYVDTDSEEVKKYAAKKGMKIINRIPELSKDTANGNDLITYWASNYHADIYFQIFVTCPFSSVETVENCVSILKDNKNCDSIFTAVKQNGWFWYNDKAVNYDPRVLPRSQDATMPIKETTGIYGIKRDALLDRKCRIGQNPYIYFVDDIEAIDIDNEFDFKLAEIILKDKNV
tara:strand:- start:4704 stop:5357 length:654 start_codon:yes stop_codon:yes gene_type:complete